jgi:phenylpyruvate tautomerase PptA (4-oxalocrotonate tautomerase family)
LPTVKVDLLDSKITVSQKRQLAESLTEIVSETLGTLRESRFQLFSDGDHIGHNVHI